MSVPRRAPACPGDGPDLTGPIDGVLRQLLTELRPDRGGPFGWRFDARAPDDAQPSPPPVRVQSSSEVPAILPGAFARAPRLSAGVLVAQRVELLRRTTPRAGDALWWLQRHGTLHDGVSVLLRALALDLATAAERARWGRTAEQRREGMAAVGMCLVRLAAATWWPPTDGGTCA